MDRLEHGFAVAQAYHEFDGGRSFYTALGHRRDTFEDPRFQVMMLAALKWAAGGEM